MTIHENKIVKLILEDGSVFFGKSFGAEIETSGEVVFNTGMVGYPQAMTDPSYKGQILVLTNPIIGNYGISDYSKHQNHYHSIINNFESNNIQINALIVSYYSREHNHWDSYSSLGNWMKEKSIPGIEAIDTRELTKKLRKKGTMLGKIILPNSSEKNTPFFNPDTQNLVSQVSINKPIIYKRGHIRVVVVDCGCKHNIIRSFIRRNITVIRVPWNYDFSYLDYDGLFISNGPGNPKTVLKTIKNIRKALKKKKPVFGICLGNQLLALAAGADTYKLKFGHRGQNQPCIEVGTKKCLITSQNHGFAVHSTLPDGWTPWFVNANDGTIEGIKHKDLPFMSVQFHPEATPGPCDTEYLFDKFIDVIKKNNFERLKRGI